MIPILEVSGIGPRLAAVLAKKSITTAEQLAATLPAALLDIPGIGAHRAKSLLTAANLAIAGTPPQSSKARKARAPAPARKAPRSAPAKVKPAVIADEGETAAAKKAKAKKAKAKKKVAAEKAATKKKLKKKAEAKKAAKKKAEKKAAKKKIKAAKGKKNGKSKKK